MGRVEWRLATAIEPSEDSLLWAITLRTDLHWSDGKPITREDVIQTISASRLAPLIEAIKTDGKNQIHLQLAEAESIFPQRLASLPIRPVPFTPSVSCDFRGLSLEAFPAGSD